MDALVTRAAADLAARGVLDDTELTIDARIELAARRREPPPDPRAPDVDARHRLLALSILRPEGAETIALARRLMSASARDPLIASALAKIALARGGAIDEGESDRLIALDPADAIAAAAALDLAKKGGDEKRIVPARARLTALARTAAERDLTR
jgi:hypothetical protein